VSITLKAKTVNTKPPARTGCPEAAPLRCAPSMWTSSGMMGAGAKEDAQRVIKRRAPRRTKKWRLSPSRQSVPAFRRLFSPSKPADIP